MFSPMAELRVVKCKVATLIKVRLQMRHTCRRVRHRYQPDVRVPRPTGSMDLRAKNKGPRMRQSGAEADARRRERERKTGVDPPW